MEKFGCFAQGEAVHHVLHERQPEIRIVRTPKWRVCMIGEGLAAVLAFVALTAILSAITYNFIAIAVRAGKPLTKPLIAQILDKTLNRVKISTNVRFQSGEKLTLLNWAKRQNCRKRCRKTSCRWC